MGVWWVAMSEATQIPESSRNVRYVLREVLGGQTKVAKALGIPRPSTVGSWIERGTIPQRWLKAVVALAQAEGVEVTLDDVVPDPKRRTAA